MKTTLKILTVATMIFAVATVSAQDAAVNEENEPKREIKVRPIRIGAKLGFPNVIGGNLEYVTPLLNKKLAVTVDYSTLNSNWFGLGEENYEEEPGYEDNYSESYSFSYMEGGLNYYFFKPGRGLYGGLSYGILKINGTYSSENSMTNENEMATIDFFHSSLNVKLGAKLGGLFYFRPEVGYSFSSMPTSYKVEEINSNGEREVYTEEFDIDGLPTILFSGFIANIGLGFAF